MVDARLNVVPERVHRPPSARAIALHARLTVVDLHADSLLWSRDLDARSRRGHVDVPRLVEGNVAVEGFSVVTQAPWGLNVSRNAPTSDQITLLAVAQLWPPRTWRSLKERALYEAWRLQDAADRSGGRLTVLRSRGGLEDYLARRSRDPRITAGFLGLEGAHALEGDLGNLDALVAAGFRMVAPVHFFDTAFGGSAHGVEKGGLTGAGRDLVQRLEERHVLLDLAHASPRTIADATAMARRPVVVSHTGVTGTCDNARNLSDDELRAVAATGGVVGVGFWGGSPPSSAVCGGDPEAVARAIRHAVEVAGVDHVGLGSDFDGTVPEPFDASGMAELTDALLAAGFDDEAVARVMGGNALRLLGQSLP